MRRAAPMARQNRGMSAIPELTRVPDPVYVMSSDGWRLATYTWGDEADPTVVLVHGFASSTRDNWVNTGWVRDLLRAGYRVLAMDQRGHGASDKPHDRREYALSQLAADVETVLDTYLVDQTRYVGYSLGARVGWEVARADGGRIPRVVLGGVPDGVPLSRLNLDEARAFALEGTPVQDRVTQNYVQLIERVGGNDLRALLAIAEGLRASGAADPDPAQAPAQPILFATGSQDAIIEGSKALAAACPQGRFVEIPGRHHFNAPGARVFREAAIAFLGEE